jgi:hypothetical protein
MMNWKGFGRNQPCSYGGTIPPSPGGTEAGVPGEVRTVLPLDQLVQCGSLISLH